MTDRDIMKLALDALENSVDLVREDAYQAKKLYGNYPTRQGKVNGLKVLADDHEKAITALTERLAQPEHHDPIGDAQDKLIAEQAATRDYRTRYDRGCYKCGSHYCPADCPIPTHLAPQQPQMQPCAGRNCGSTNPNLHSAECFEDYEKSTGMSQWQSLTEEEINNSYLFWVVDQQDVIGFGKSLETKLKRKNI